MNENLIKSCAKEDLPEPYNLYAEVIGIENLYLLAKEFGGTSVYIPRTQYLLKETVGNALSQEFDGSNYKKLAQKYDLSERTIRNWLRQKKHPQSPKSFYQKPKH